MRRFCVCGGKSSCRVCDCLVAETACAELVVLLKLLLDKSPFAEINEARVDDGERRRCDGKWSMPRLTRKTHARARTRTARSACDDGSNVLGVDGGA